VAPAGAPYAAVAAPARLRAGPIRVTSDPTPLVDRRERDRRIDNFQAQLGVADPVLDRPALTVPAPVLHPPLLAGHQQDLAHRGDLTVVVELARAVAGGRGGRRCMKSSQERTGEIHDRRKTRERTERLWVRTGRQEFEVFEVPADALVLNVDNRRFRVRRLWAEEQLGRPLDPEAIPEDDKTVESLLLDDSLRLNDEATAIVGTSSPTMSRLRMTSDGIVRPLEIFHDRPVAQEVPAGNVEGEDVAASRRLVAAPRDRAAGYAAFEKRADAAVPHEKGGSRRIAGKRPVDRPLYAVRGIHRPFPASPAFLRLGEECVGRGLECGRLEITGRGTVILPHLRDDLHRQAEMRRHDRSRLDRLHLVAR
jgi:hypothetical protein